MLQYANTMPYIVKDKIRFLSEASKVLSSSLDYNVTLSIVAKLVVESIADFCIIDVMEEGTLHRVVVRVSDPKKKPLADKMFHFLPDPRNKQAIYDSAKTGNSIVINKVTKTWLKTVSRFKEERDIVEKLNLQALVFAPLKSRGQVIGVLTIGSSTKGFTYTQDDVLYVEEIASRAGIAVDKALLYSKAQEALRMRDEFLSIASHELKTPLTSILLNLQFMQYKIQNATKKEVDIQELSRMLEVNKEQVQRMSRLINDLLNTSVITTGRLQIEKEKTDLSPLVHDVLSRFETQLKHLKIKVTFQDKKGVVGNWDKLRIEQVVTNLISNAIKYGDNKPLEISIKSAGGKAFIAVKDKGIGISPESQKHIFGIFERGVSGRDYKGLGVGLYIAAHIVEAHGGKLTVVSKLNKGSTFTVELPLK